MKSFLDYDCKSVALGRVDVNMPQTRGNTSLTQAMSGPCWDPGDLVNL